MKLLFPIAALLSCVFLFMYLPLFAVYCDTLEADFEQYHLDKVLELSTRAAAENGLEYGLVDFDREILLDLEFNSSAVSETYSQFMCYNYNLVPTDANRKYVLSRSVLMVVGSRGFTVTQSEYGDFYLGDDAQFYRVTGAVNPGDAGGHTVALNTGTSTVFSPYTLFTVRDNHASPDVVRLVGGSLLSTASAFPVYERNTLNDRITVHMTSDLPGDITSSRIQQEALAAMTRAFTQSWNQLALQSPDDKQLVLPDTITSLGVSSAATPGVMALVEGINLGSYKALRSEAFTGYKAILKREVIAFTQTLNGVTARWYCYRDQFDTAAAEKGSDGYAGVVIQYVYADMYAAVRAGYQPHLGFLSK